MSTNTQKLVRILPGPTGPTGTFEGINILPSFTGPTGTFPQWGQVSAAQQGSSPTGAFKSVYPLVGANSGKVKTAIVPALLLDSFGRASANLNGQLPDIGSAWSTSLVSGGSIITGGDNTIEQSGGTAGYATNNCAALIGEVGCKFKLSAVSNSVVVGGSAANGNQIFCNIYPSRQGSNFIYSSYTLTGTDTLATAAAALGAAMTTNIAGRFGLTVSVVGTTITVNATECPKLAPANVGSTTVTGANSEQPTLANYVTGNNFLNGMLHFYAGVDGTLLWTVYNNGLIAYQSFTQGTLIGLSANTEYTYRCCISAPYIWGGLWGPDGTLLNAAWAQDNSAVAAYQGNSCFFETGGGAQLKYTKAWAYGYPSVSLAAIQAAA